MRVADAVSTETQSIVDDASDATAEARRQAKIDAAVRERMAELEKGVRDEVIAKVDAEGAEA
jgi:phage gp29-like protein